MTFQFLAILATQFLTAGAPGADLLAGLDLESLRGDGNAHHIGARIPLTARATIAADDVFQNDRPI
jgi:hypothetical protein